MTSVGDDAAEHRQTCAISLIVVTYSCPDYLDPLLECYPGPPSKPRKGNFRRVEWIGKHLSLNAKYPVNTADMRSLGDEIGQAVTLQMFRDPPWTVPRSG